MADARRAGRAVFGDIALVAARIFSQQGGCVFNTIHNLQAHTPVENIVAMLDAIHEFNGSRAAV